MTVTNRTDKSFYKNENKMCNEKVKILLIPIENTKNQSSIVWRDNYGDGVLFNDLLNVDKFSNVENCVPFHMHILSTKPVEIDDGGSFLKNNFGNYETFSRRIINKSNLSNSIHKIIATTDKDLFGTMLIPIDFIIEFVCKFNELYENDESKFSSKVIIDEAFAKLPIGGIKYFRPKENGDIDIKFIKQNFTREEMLDFGMKCGIAGSKTERDKTPNGFNEAFLELVDKYL